jgi:hypothetical protein
MRKFRRHMPTRPKSAQDWIAPFYWSAIPIERDRSFLFVLTSDSGKSRQLVLGDAGMGPRNRVNLSAGETDRICLKEAACRQHATKAGESITKASPQRHVSRCPLS